MNARIADFVTVDIIFRINFIFLMFINSSCDENKNCDDDVYIPDIAEEYGVNDYSNIRYTCEYNSVGSVLHYKIIKCNNRCLYNNDKYYCVGSEHLRKYLKQTCCDYGEVSPVQGLYYTVIDPECGSALED